MTIDTSKEAVERLASRLAGTPLYEGSGEDTQLGEYGAETITTLAAERDAHTARADAAEAEVARLTAELTAMRAGQDALVAAACMSMRDRCADMVEREGHGLHVAIRHAPIPADATAALAVLLRAERNKALRDASEAVEELCPHADIPGGNCIPDKFDEGTSAAYETILAMIETEGQ